MGDTETVGGNLRSGQDGGSGRVGDGPHVGGVTVGEIRQGAAEGAGEETEADREGTCNMFPITVSTLSGVSGAGR